jgi:hypothetical protein
MNISGSLIPLAAAAIDTAIHGVDGVLQSTSQFAEMFRAPTPGERSKNVTPHDPTNPEPSSLAQQIHQRTLRQQFETLRTSIHQQVTERLSAAGVELSEPVVLSLDAEGRLLETGKHWERGRIEEALQDDSRLKADIAQLLAHARSLSQLGSPVRQSDVDGASRIVVGQKEAFVQVF